MVSLTPPEDPSVNYVFKSLKVSSLCQIPEADWERTSILQFCKDFQGLVSDFDMGLGMDRWVE